MKAYENMSKIEKLKMMLEEESEVVNILAKAHKMKYDALVKAGFTNEQAMYLLGQEVHAIHTQKK